MDDVNNSVMLALLPMTSDWCRIEIPHMTLVFAGDKNVLPQGAFNDMAKDAASIAMLANPISLRVIGQDVFGPDDKRVDVLRLRTTPELMAMRRGVRYWDASEYSFKPHVTVGPEGSIGTLERIPDYIAFDRIMVGWGNDQLTFWLKR